MAYTESEKRELINSIKAESVDVTRLEPIDTLEGVTSLPVLSGTRLVTAPVSILGQPALDAAESANEAAAAANEAAAAANEAAEAVAKTVGTISIEDIDLESWDATKKTSFCAGTSNEPSHYKVTNSQGILVGTLVMYSDWSLHQITQIFTTNCVLTDHGFDGTHNDTEFYTYRRNLDREGSGFSSEWSAWTVQGIIRTYHSTDYFPKGTLVSHNGILYSVLNGTKGEPSPDNNDYRALTVGLGDFSQALERMGAIEQTHTQDYQQLSGAITAEQTQRQSDIQTLNESITEISTTLWPLELEVTPSFTLAEYTGTPVALNVTRRVLRKGQLVAAGDITSVRMTVSDRQTSVRWDDTNLPQKTCEGEITDYGVHNVILQVSACGMTASVQKDVRLELPCYFGFSTAASVSDLDLAALQKQSVRTSPNGTYSLQNPSNGRHMWLCVPSRMTISKVTSSGFEVPMLPAETSNEELGEYKCYRSASASGLNSGTIKITIS